MYYIFSFIGVALIASFTPGPNNSMLLQSGISFGYKKTIPHIIGIVIGFSILFISINVGFYALIQKFEILLLLIKIIGTVYFSYLAYKIITAPPPTATEEQKKQGKKRVPFTLIQAILFQWINIKAWFFSVAVIGTLPSQRSFFEHIIIQSIIIVLSAASAITWTMLGVGIQRIFNRPLYFRIINAMLGLVLLYAGISPWIIPAE